MLTVVPGARIFWLGLLKRRFPSLEFVRNMTLRTATDTMRNQGIITLLLTVKGKFELALIKQRLEVTHLHTKHCHYNTVIWTNHAFHVR
jgi:hypothetical protein